MNTTIQKHLDGKRLQADPVDDPEVLGFWRKALVAQVDATNATVSLENRMLRAYDAARIAATAIVRAAGYRTRGDGHHHITFDVARSLVSDVDLKRALDTMDALRKVRHDVEYEAEGEVDERTLTKALRGADQVIALGRVHLQKQRPGLLRHI